MQIRKIATSYNEAEDRIELLGERKEGAALSLFLTQRLLTRLLPGVFWLIEQQQPGLAQRRLEPLAAGARPPIRDEPVPAQWSAGASECWLVQRVDATALGQGGVQLVFHGDGERAGRINLDGESARAWLGLLLEEWRKAGWPDRVWPAWLGQPSPQLPLDLDGGPVGEVLH